MPPVRAKLTRAGCAHLDPARQSFGRARQRRCYAHAVSPTVLPVATRALVDACERLGLDTEALLDRAGLDRVRLSDPDARIDAERADAVWREAHALAGDPALALHAAEQTPFGAFRVLDYLGASGASLGEGLRRVAAYFPLVDPRATLAVEAEDDAVALAFRGAGTELPPQAQEYTLAILASRVRHVAPGAALAVRFAFPRPHDVREHARVFGVEPRFGVDRAALALSRAEWERPTASSDPGLFAALDDHARRLLERSGPAPLAERVRAAIAADLAGHEPSLPAAARRVGVSPRSVQRRLAEAGTSFARTVDAVREERAKVFLRSGDVSLAEVSWLLGFSEQSAFTRAFRRWTGVSPTEWRRASSSARR
jgi:AraC-like DNA-binding protein